MIIIKTPAGKEISTKIDPRSNHIKIQFTQGGELPEELSGLFTTDRQASLAIDSYLAKKQPKTKE